MLTCANCGNEIEPLRDWWRHKAFIGGRWFYGCYKYDSNIPTHDLTGKYISARLNDKQNWWIPKANDEELTIKTNISIESKVKIEIEEIPRGRKFKNFS